MIKPAIVAVGYNRIESLKRLLLSVENADYSSDDITLIISIDCGDNIDEMKKMSNDFKWTHGNKIVRAFDVRQGLKKHILQCGDLSYEYGAVIVLEDDLLVAPDYYGFAEQAINYYSENENVAGVGLYSHEWNGYAFCPFQKRIIDADAFAGQFSITWGQCWCKERWKDFRKWYDENKVYRPIDNIPERINRWSEQSWGKFFVKYLVERNLFYIVPYNSLTTNFSEIGEHSKVSNANYQVGLSQTHNKHYILREFGDLVKYDIFFEPILDTKQLFNIAEEEITVDLNATRKRRIKTRYILTTKMMKYDVVQKFGLQLRPIEMNVIYGIRGDSIMLYDTSKKHHKPATQSYDKTIYDIRGFTFLQTIPFSFFSVKTILKAKVLMYCKRLKK